MNFGQTEKESILRETYLRALEVAGPRKIRTVWICLWSSTPMFQTAVHEWEERVDVLLMAFVRSEVLQKVVSSGPQAGPGQDRVHFIGTRLLDARSRLEAISSISE